MYAKDSVQKQQHRTAAANLQAVRCRFYSIYRARVRARALSIREILVIASCDRRGMCDRTRGEAVRALLLIRCDSAGIPPVYCPALSSAV